MNEVFLPQLNAFTEQIKETNRIHVSYILSMSKWLQELSNDCKALQQDLTVEKLKSEITENADKSEFYQMQINQSKEFEKSALAFRHIIQNQINDMNIVLGGLSNHWGGYIEMKGVEYLSNWLRKEHGVQTFMYKYKRFWHKSRNIELDLVGLTDTMMFIVEVKNQLKTEHFTEMDVKLERIREQLPEFSQLKLQPIILCMSVGNDISEIIENQTNHCWIVRYKGFDRENPKDFFDWIVK